MLAEGNLKVPGVSDSAMSRVRQAVRALIPASGGMGSSRWGLFSFARGGFVE
jgi:hypothetical protein